MTERRGPGRPPKNDTEDDVANDPYSKLGEIYELASQSLDTKIYLYRIEPRSRLSREEAFLERFDSDRAPTLEEIRERFGGGTFRIRLRVSGRITGDNARFSIEGPPRFVEDERPIHASANGGANKSPLEERLDRLELLLTSKPADDDAAEERRDRREMRRMIREIAMAKALSSNGQDPLQLVELMFDMVDRGRKEGEDTREPNWFSVLENALEKFTPAPAPIPAPRPRPGQIASSAPAPSTKDFLGYVAELAEKNEPPENFIEWALAMLPADMVPKIENAPLEAWLAMFAQFAGDHPIFTTAAGTAWLARLLDCLKAAIKRRGENANRVEPPPIAE